MSSLVRMQQRRDTAANWASANPVLASGEIGYDSTNLTLRVGDGTTAWASLPIQTQSNASGVIQSSAGITVSAGTTAIQALTCTTIAATGVFTLTVSGYITIMSGLAGSGALVAGGWISGRSEGLNITPNNDGITAKKVVLAYFDGGAYQSALEYANTSASAKTVLGLNLSGGDIQWGTPLVSLGGGSAPTLGTIGGSGPATATQNSWMRVKDNGGVAFWVPVWK